ncbi:Putative uncharacterized protein Yba3 [Buchnera aphidicola (Thelaxes suberi)]|uniref:hypothetical protein n=1 Tax=Buchnera aphidicola TaxID=9 RepID=UPI003464B53D
MTSFTPSPGTTLILDKNNLPKTYYDFAMMTPPGTFKNTNNPPEYTKDGIKNPSPSAIITIFPEEKSFIYSGKIPDVDYKIDTNKFEPELNYNNQGKLLPETPPAPPINLSIPDYPLKIKQLEKARHYKWDLPGILHSLQRNKNENDSYNLDEFTNELKSKFFLDFELTHFKTDEFLKKQSLPLLHPSINKDDDLLSSKFLSAMSNSFSEIFNNVVKKSIDSDHIFPIMYLFKTGMVPIRILYLLKQSVSELTKQYNPQMHPSLREAAEKNYFNNQFDARREFLKYINQNIDNFNGDNTAFGSSNDAIIWNQLPYVNNSKDVASLAKKYASTFQLLNKTMQLHDGFLSNFENAYFQINGKDMSSATMQNFTKDFTNAIPDFDLQQLVSLYANDNLFNNAYLSLFSDHPQLLDCTPLFPSFHYKIDVIDANTIKIVGVNTAILQKNGSLQDKHTKAFFGVRTSVVVSKNAPPKLEYSYFVN